MQASLIAMDSENLDDIIAAKLTEAYAYYRVRSLPSVSTTTDRCLEALLATITLSMEKYVDEVAFTKKLIPLSAFLLTVKLLMQQGAWTQAIKIALYASDMYISAALSLLLGICYLRLDSLDDAEEVFMEANLLDNRHPDIWA
jgi:hypothetical protein